MIKGAGELIGTVGTERRVDTQGAWNLGGMVAGTAGGAGGGATGAAPGVQRGQRGGAMGGADGARMQEAIRGLRGLVGVEEFSCAWPWWAKGARGQRGKGTTGEGAGVATGKRG